MTVLRPGQQHPRLPLVPEDTVLRLGRRPGRRRSASGCRQHYGRIDVPTMIEIIKRPVAMNSNLHNAIFSPETLEMWFADAGRNTRGLRRALREVRSGGTDRVLPAESNGKVVSVAETSSRVRACTHQPRFPR